MRRIMCAVLLLALFGACKQAGKRRLSKAVQDPSLAQERTIAGTNMQLAYLPACWEANMDNGTPDKTELSFRLRVFPAKQAGVAVNDNAASFGTDSLFMLVVAGDSLKPRYTERIANGNVSGVEYLVVFDRAALKQATSAVVVFRDWLFTHSVIEFPYITENINKTDELSCSL